MATALSPNGEVLRSGAAAPREPASATRLTENPSALCFGHGTVRLIGELDRPRGPRDGCAPRRGTGRHRSALGRQHGRDQGIEVQRLRSRGSPSSASRHRRKQREFVTGVDRARRSAPARPARHQRRSGRKPSPPGRARSRHGQRRPRSAPARRRTVDCARAERSAYAQRRTRRDARSVMAEIVAVVATAAKGPNDAGIDARSHRTEDGDCRPANDLRHRLSKPRRFQLEFGSIGLIRPPSRATPCWA